MQAVIKLIRRRAVAVGAGGLLLSLWGPIACGDGDTLPAGQGGAGAGGSAGKGGNGGTAVGGNLGEGGQEEETCPTVAFVTPTDGATLTDADDVGAATDPNSCSDGFQYNVKVSTSAANGTKATLYSGGNRVAEASVTGGFATFEKAQLSIGTDALKVQIGADACPSTEATISVSCAGLPTCHISSPVISETHPALNGVPVAQGGDRASAAGSPYQVAFEVTTNIEDGRPVNLRINSSTQLLTAQAGGGKAQFDGVPLSPDGEFTIVAICQGASGKTSVSGEAMFTVDTAPPELAVTEPVAGKHFGPNEDSDPTTAGQQFQVCGSTHSSDALNLPSSLGGAQNNFCVGLGTATPICAPATGDGSGAPCVTLTCQDRVSFDLTVTLGDGAGNKSQSTVQGVSCSSSLPGVSIVEPVDGTGPDVSTHILAATATSGRKDEDATKNGAQFTVVACTDVGNAPMTLLGGVKGGSSQTLATATSVAAVASDNCPVGKPFVAKFVKATLPESEQAALGALINPTELTVTASDKGSVGTSPSVDVWVDSVPPSINQYIPNPLCGALLQGTTTVTQSVTLLTGSAPVLATVTNSGTTASYTAATAPVGQASLGAVSFGQGANEFVATTVDPAGNPGALVSPCIVTVGNAPKVSWVSPLAKLNIGNDTDSGASGWQGSLSVQTDLANTGATIQFSTGAGNLGTPVAIDGTGKATSPVLTIADGASVTLTATTSEVPGRGVGVANQTVVVDTLPPAAISGLAASVPPAKRRQTTFHLAWVAPGDNGASVTSYDVRIAKGTPITAGNFDAQERVTYSAAPAPAGGADGVDAADRLIENDYYFAVAPIDKGGNRGPISSAGPTAAHFNSTILASTITDELFGSVIDGSTSLDGDAYSDLVVGTAAGQTVYIYMGSASGYPSVATSKIVGSTIGFGSGLSVIGDIDSDGLPDLAVGSQNDGNGAVYIFKGRQPWPSSLQQSDADYTVKATNSAFAGALNGYAVARVGDFNNDSIDDFAIGAPTYNGAVGRISVVFGVAKGQPFGTFGVVSLPEDYGTKAVEIDGSGGNFGQRLAGLGRYYTGGGSTFVTTAPVSPGSAFAFHGVSGAGAITTPNQTFVGSNSAGRTGLALSYLGGGNGLLPLVGIGSPAYGTSPPAGQVDLFAGNVATGPFSGTHAIYTNSRATTVGDGFGIMVLGGAFANGITTSFIGDSAPDVVLGGLNEAGAATHVYFLTGQNAMTSGTRDVVSAADISFQMPADWRGCSFLSSGVRDSNSDGYGDIAIGEWRRTSGYNGRVLVLW